MIRLIERPEKSSRAGCYVIPHYRIAERLRADVDYTPADAPGNQRKETKKMRQALAVIALLAVSLQPALALAKAGGPGASSGGGNSGENGNGGAASGGVGGVGSGGNGVGVGGADGSGNGGGNGGGGNSGGGNGNGSGNGGSDGGGNSGGSGGGAAGSTGADAGTAGGTDGGGNSSALATGASGAVALRVETVFTKCARLVSGAVLLTVRPDGTFSFSADTSHDAGKLARCFQAYGYTFHNYTHGGQQNFAPRSN